MKRLTLISVFVLLSVCVFAGEADDLQIIKGLVRDNTFTVAVSRMESFLNDYPDSTHRREVREMLISSCLSGRYYDKVHRYANQYLSDYCSEAPESCASVILYDATAFYLESQFKEAQDRLSPLSEGIRKQGPDIQKTYYQLYGDVAFARNQFSDAVDSYNDFLKLGFDNVVRVKQGVSYYHLKKYSKAMRVLSRLEEEGFKSTELFRYLGLLNFSKEKYEAASAYFEKAGQTEDKLFEVHTLMKMDRKSDAYTLLRQVVPIAKLTPEELAFYRIRKHVNLGELIEARKLLEKTVLPDNDRVLNLAFSVYDRLREYSVASQKLHTLALISNHPARDFYRLAEYRLTKLNDATGAFGYYGKVLEKDPEGPYASLSLMNRIKCSLYMGDKDKALAMTTTFLKQYGVSSPITDEAYFVLGKLMLDRGKYDEAIKSFENIMANYPESNLRGDTAFLLADAYFRNGMFTDAKEAAMATVSKKYQGRAVDLAAESAYFSGRYSDAVPLFAEVKKNRPEGVPEDLYAFSLALSGNLDAALKESGDNSGQQFAVCQRVGNGEKALQIALKEDPMDPDHLYQVSQMTEDNATRKQLLVKAVELSDATATVHTLALSALEPIAVDEGDYQTLMDLEPAFVQYDPEEFHGAQAILKKARKYRENGKLSKAISLYQMSVRAYPDAPGNDEAYYFLYQYAKPRNPARLEKILETYPEGEYAGLAAYNSGLLKFKDHDYSAAITLFQKALSRNDPSMTDLMFAVHYYLGVTFEKTGDTKDAITQYREYLKEIPADVHQVGERIRISLLFQKEGLLDDAMNELKRVSELPEAVERKAEITYYIAECLEAQGHLQEALQQYLAVTYLHSSEIMWSTTARFKAAKICEQLEYYDDAVKLYQKIASAHKGEVQGDFAKKKLDELKKQKEAPQKQN